MVKSLGGYFHHVEVLEDVAKADQLHLFYLLEVIKLDNNVAQAKIAVDVI